MNSNKERIEKAQDIALECLEYIINCTSTPDYVEVTGRIGSDIVIYHVYDDGSIRRMTTEVPVTDDIRTIYPASLCHTP